MFNITVEGCPEFFANGVLVHNCDAGLYGSRAHRAYLHKPAKNHAEYDKWSTVAQRKERNRRKQARSFREFE